MGILGSAMRFVGASRSQKDFKQLDQRIINLANHLSAGHFESEDQMRTEAENLIEEFSGEKIKVEEAAFATVWGLGNRIKDIVSHRAEPSEQEIRYYSASLQSILELSEEYKTAELRAEHRPHMIAYALYYLDMEVSQKASRHRKKRANEYKKAKENGDQERMQKFEELIEEELKEEMQHVLEDVEYWKEEMDKKLQ